MKIHVMQLYQKFQHIIIIIADSYHKIKIIWKLYANVYFNKSWKNYNTDSNIQNKNSNGVESSFIRNKKLRASDIFNSQYKKESVENTNCE